MRSTIVFIVANMIFQTLLAQTTMVYQFDNCNKFVNSVSSNRISNYQYDEVGNRIGMVITKKSSTDINQTTSELGVKLYPNPTSESFAISGFEDYADIKLTNISGKMIFSKSVLENEVITIKSLPKGIYIVEINTEKGVVVERKLLVK